MVRLKDKLYSVVPYVIVDFNSSMVRLKVEIISRSLGQSDHFNSSMVRLKEGTQRIAGMPLIFQFLYGSIKRISSSVQKAKKILFQFLYGSIKRAAGLRAEYKLPHFNSSMVRLKGA